MGRMTSRLTRWFNKGKRAMSPMQITALVFAGLILLGAYSTADLSETDLSVLSVYGSEDLVMNRKKYRSNLENLPADFTEIIIDGGCHAYFGMYGHQDGDGTPKITNEEQIRFTANVILDLINK